MSHLASRHLKKILEAVAIIHTHSQGKFHERLFEALSVAFDGSCHSFELFAQDGTHWGQTNVPIEPTHVTSYLDRIAELAPKQNPVFQQVALGVTEPLRLSDFVSHREFIQRDFYQDIFKPVDVDCQIAIPLSTGFCVGGITINRGHKDFNSEDLEMARMLTPHVLVAFESDRLLVNLKKSITIHSVFDFTALRRRGLTRREAEIACWLMDGKRDKEIAVILNLSSRTVQHFVGSILRKLKVETRTAAVAELLKSDTGVPRRATRKI